jgi:hypothetical protein
MGRVLFSLSWPSAPHVPQCTLAVLGRQKSKKSLRPWLCLVPLALGLAACAPLLDEPRQYYWNQEWGQFKQYWPWQPTQRPLANGLGRQNTIRHDGCQLWPSENRVTLQEGVSDKVNYRQCGDAPYPQGPYASGQRMKHRPEPLD